MSIFKDFGSAARGNAAPVTTAIVVLMIVSFVACWMNLMPALGSLLEFAPAQAVDQPWSFVTYPFAFTPMDFLSAFFACLWLWGIGGSVERELGTVKYVCCWLLFTAFCAVCVWLGSSILHAGTTFIMGPWNPITAVTVMWATRNPNVQILFMFVIPLQARWLGWISVAFVFFSTHPPQVAPFAMIPFILAYFYAANRLPLGYSAGDRKYGGQTKKWERYDKSYYEEVQRREKDRLERERLRKLFEGSIKDDEER